MNYKLFLTWFFCLTTVTASIAQTQLHTPFQLVVKFKDGSKFRGRLVELGKDFIRVSKERKLELPAERAAIRDIPIGEIATLRFRRSPWRGVGIGAAAGAALGVTSGFISGDDPSGWFALQAEEKALILGITLAIPGAVVGGLVGLAQKVFAIDGEQAKFEAQRERLSRFEMRVRDGG